MQKTIVVQYSDDLEQLKELLPASGLTGVFCLPNQSVWQMKTQGGVITAYQSGKIVVQGKDQGWLDRVRLLIQDQGYPLDSVSDESSLSPHIGVDEAGKGDFFGPLVVGAVFVESEDMGKKLRTKGVRDSKELSDHAAKEVASAIRDLCPHHVVVVLAPTEYNRRYAKVRNANILLAQLHAQAIEEVLANLPSGACTSAVIDQFSSRESRVVNELLAKGRELTLIQMHKGERDVAVAAASILARDGFLRGLALLSQKYEIEFPKGATHVVLVGREFVRRFDAGRLDEVAKTSFRTMRSVTAQFDS